MESRFAWLLVLIGLAMIASGCRSPLYVAVATTNAAATGLRVTHADMASRYRAEQVEAANRVQGDRSDTTVRAEQQDRVDVVRERWSPVWAAYAVAYHAWLAAAAACSVAIEADTSGGAPAYIVVFAILRTLAASQGKLLAALGALQ